MKKMILMLSKIYWHRYSQEILVFCSFLTRITALQSSLQNKGITLHRGSPDLAKPERVSLI